MARRLSFFALLLMLLAVLLPAHASAGNVQILYRWLITFDFDSGDDGVLTVTVRTLYPNGTYQDISSQTPIKCAPDGSVPVAGGVATFANQGYLDCDLPSIRNEIRKLYPPATPNDYQDPFWIQVISALNTGITTGATGNPVIAHPDIRLFVPYDSGTGLARARVVTSSHDVASPKFTPVAGGMLTAFQRNWWDENGNNTCTQRFQYQNTTVPLISYNCPQFNEAMNFALDAATFTIGYAPGAGTYFNGTIDNLVIDPVEWGVLD